MTMDLAEPVVLDQARHIRYWRRCLKTLLPHHYTGNESNRMYLAFFILSALDLLDAFEQVTNPQERKDYIDWIYHCQHPAGGFRMWPGTDFGPLRNEENAKWDPANVPATFFALSALLAAGDDLERVRRKETLIWIRQMQRPDGSFGETLVDGEIHGGMDPRYGYCAAGVRYILRGQETGTVQVGGVAVEDIDVDGFVRCIRLAESYDGGIADYAYHEPHAGYEYCSLGALNFLGRLATPTSDRTTVDNDAPIRAPSDPDATIRWLVERQTDLEDIEEELEFSEEEAPAPAPAPSSTSSTSTDQPPAPKKPKTDPFPSDSQPIPSSSSSTNPLHQSPDRSTLLPNTGFMTLSPPDAGMNGRTNKVADTCYAWWTGASFHLMHASHLYCHSRLRRYLLEKTQHPTLGGFGKFPGDLPDLYHSYLGLAALGLLDGDGEGGVQRVDPGLCVSRRASGRLKGIWEGWKERERGEKEGMNEL
ncbi:Geranylgeranyl transferase type-1 subunit beta [Sphaerulina musiva]